MKNTAKEPVRKSEEATPSGTPKARRVQFCLQAEAGSKVFLTGSFNNWDPIAKEMVDKDKDGHYAASVMLAPGKYQYKFVVDGTWCVDPACGETIHNDLGTLNSVKHVL